MRLGIFAKTFPGTEPLGVLDQARATGFASVQYNFACSGLGALPASIPPDALDAIARAARRSDVAIAALSATYNMTDPDTSRRDAGRAAFSNICRAARQLAVPVVTVCSGSKDAEDQWRHHPDNDTPAAWSEMCAEFERIIPVARQHGVRIGVEPELANIVNSAERARRLLDGFPGGGIGIVLDAVNLVAPGHEDAHRKTIVRAIDLIGNDIILAHAKDRAGDGLHVAPGGAGVIDWPFYLRQLHDAGFAGDLIAHGFGEKQAKPAAVFLQKQIDNME